MRRCIMRYAALLALVTVLLLPARMVRASADLPGATGDTVSAMDIIRTVGSAEGRVVIVNFWATWCPPCRREIPELNHLRGQYSPEDVLLMGISVDEDEAAYTDFVAEQDFTYPVRRAEQSVPRFFRISGIPRVMVYDTAGKLVVNHEGMVTADQLGEVVDSLLEQK